MLYNIATNDADYNVEVRSCIKGKRQRLWVCPIYKTWIAMLSRCYGTKSKTNRKSPTVCEEWLTFSNFKSWMEQQDWEGKELDKDLLVYRNNIYSLDTCCFLSHALNTFLCSSNKTRGLYPIGVNYHIDPKMVNPCKKAYRSQISDGSKKRHLGYYLTPEEAHKVWQLAKISIGTKMLNEIYDEKVRAGLLRVINKLQYDYDNSLITEEF